MDNRKVPKPIAIHTASATASTPPADHKIRTFSNREATTPAPVTPNRGPRVMFADAAFKIDQIDADILPLIQKQGDFTETELARINHIIVTEFEDVIERKIIYHNADNLLSSSKKAHEILVACLNNTVANDINNVIAHILTIINPKPKSNANSIASKIGSMLSNLVHEKDEEEELTFSEISNILDADIYNLTNLIPDVNVIVESIQDAIFHASQEYKNIKLYHAAGKVRIEQLENYDFGTQNVKDPLQVQKIMDKKNAYDLFVRRIDSLRVMLEFISAGILQAQMIQGQLETQLSYIQSMLDVTVPAFKQQLLMMQSLNLKQNEANAKGFEEQKLIFISLLENTLKAGK